MTLVGMSLSNLTTDDYLQLELEVDTGDVLRAGSGLDLKRRASMYPWTGSESVSGGASQAGLCSRSGRHTRGVQKLTLRLNALFERKSALSCRSCPPGSKKAELIHSAPSRRSREVGSPSNNFVPGNDRPEHRTAAA